MKQLIFDELSLQDIQEIAICVARGIVAYEWLDVDGITLDPEINRQLENIMGRLINTPVTLMNDATVWSRAIYPLLTLAENNEVMAWSQVPLSATYPHVELSGVTDGALAPNFAGEPTLPYFVVVEAKRIVEAKNPCIQLYGQLLAVARLHYEQDQQTSQEIFGCYTISDSWTFIRAMVEQIDTESPHLTIESSREYIEKIEAETILRILNRILIKVQESRLEE